MEVELCKRCKYSSLCLGSGRVAVVELFRKMPGGYICDETDTPCRLASRTKDAISEHNATKVQVVFWAQVESIVKALPWR
jgi:hypothetical protein